MSAAITAKQYKTPNPSVHRHTSSNLFSGQTLDGTQSSR